MGEDGLIPGRLEMPQIPCPDLVAGMQWEDVLSNRILVAISVVLLIFNIRNIFSLIPPLLYSVSRPRGSAELEYNLSLATRRNRMAAVCIIPFTLVCSAYGLYSPDFMERIPLQWQSAAVAGVLAGYAILRTLLHLALGTRRLGKEGAVAARKCAYSFFVLATPVMLFLSGIFCISRVPDSIARVALHIVIGLFFLASTIRTAQILRQHCNGLAAFLYLCGLEILPSAAVVLSAVML